jgi:hypothetical protein
MPYIELNAELFSVACKLIYDATRVKMPTEIEQQGG